jgi:mRNA-degrading endonuclease RelE of RelBE toxin-antitoxin system
MPWLFLDRLFADGEDVRGIQGAAYTMTRFCIDFTDEAKIDLTSFSAYERKINVDEVRHRLTHEPAVQTRNRKMLRDHPLARWELRVGKFRVFYEVGEDASTVTVGAVGFKRHNRLFIRGQEVRL